MRKMNLVVLAILLAVFLSVTAYASEQKAVPDDETKLLLEDIDFCIQDICSGHPSFVHYLAREDGWFAIYTRSTESADATENVFSRAYIDLFNPSGELQFEISLFTRDDLTLNFSSELIEIYLCEYMISVDIATKEVTKTQTSRHFAKDNGLHAKFIEKTQIAGEWTYSCSGHSMNYTSLVREKDNAKEILLSLSGNVPGAGISKRSFIASAMTGCVFLLIPCILLKKRSNKRKKR